MELPKLLIEINPDGGVKVTGPVNDKVLSYGMLEAAKDAIRDHIAKNQSPIVVAPPGTIRAVN